MTNFQTTLTAVLLIPVMYLTLFLGVPDYFVAIWMGWAAFLWYATWDEFGFLGFGVCLCWIVVIPLFWAGACLCLWGN